MIWLNPETASISSVTETSTVTVVAPPPAASVAISQEAIDHAVGLRFPGMRRIERADRPSGSAASAWSILPTMSRVSTSARLSCTVIPPVEGGQNHRAISAVKVSEQSHKATRMLDLTPTMPRGTGAMGTRAQLPIPKRIQRCRRSLGNRGSSRRSSCPWGTTRANSSCPKTTCGLSTRAVGARHRERRRIHSPRT